MKANEAMFRTPLVLIFFVGAIFLSANSCSLLTSHDTDLDDWQLKLSPEPTFWVRDDKFSTKIFPAYPNPSSESVTLRFALSKRTPVSFKIFDNNNRLIKTLVAESLEAGYHSIVWRLKDEKGRRVTSGIYRCKYSWQAIVCTDTRCFNTVDVNVNGHGDIRVQ